MLQRGRLVFPLLFLVVFCPHLRGQESAPTPAQFKASVRTVEISAPQWRKVIESVNVEDLPVEYATGKRFEQSKYVVREDLKMVLLWGSHAAQSGSLFDEINYMSAVQELQAQLQLFGSLLGEFNISDHTAATKVGNWAEAMSNVANGPIEGAFKTAYTYTTRHALQIEKGCAK